MPQGRVGPCFTSHSIWKALSYEKLANVEQTVTVGASFIQPAPVVRDLGVLLDQEPSVT